MATRGENTFPVPQMLRQTYLLLCELLWNGIDFIIGEVDFDQRVRLPPVLGQLKLVNLAQVHWEGRQALTLQRKCACLLGAFESRFDGFGASRGAATCSCVSSGIGIGVCLRCIVNIWVALGCGNSDLSSATKVISTRVLEEVCVCSASHRYVCLFTKSFHL